MDVAALFARIDLFRSLSDATRRRLARVVHLERYAAGAWVLFEGDPCQNVYFIVAGRVSISRTAPSGREQVLAELGPGEAFNVVPALQPAAIQHATVRALTPLTLLSITREDFLSLVQECPDWALALLRNLAERISRMVNLVADLSLLPVRGRLARFLLAHASEGAVTRRWTQEEIAAHIGTVRDVVGRTLRQFADEGLIRLERQRIMLVDRERLKAEAER